ncbi:MAG: hypothetical protein K2R98_19920 [Gemmataceae bacterium]|nr:hypothetical protein [Gemmataceae bacterium]
MARTTMRMERRRRSCLRQLIRDVAEMEVERQRLVIEGEQMLCVVREVCREIDAAVRRLIGKEEGK